MNAPQKLRAQRFKMNSFERIFNADQFSVHCAVCTSPMCFRTQTTKQQQHFTQRMAQKNWLHKHNVILLIVCEMLIFFFLFNRMPFLFLRSFRLVLCRHRCYKCIQLRRLFSYFTYSFIHSFGANIAFSSFALPNRNEGHYPASQSISAKMNKREGERERERDDKKNWQQ